MKSLITYINESVFDKDILSNESDLERYKCKELRTKLLKQLKAHRKFVKKNELVNDDVKYLIRKGECSTEIAEWVRDQYKQIENDETEGLTNFGYFDNFCEGFNINEYEAGKGWDSATELADTYGCDIWFLAIYHILNNEEKYDFE